MIARFLLLALTLLAAAPAAAQTFPALSGRVVDQAELLAPEQEAALDQRLEALQRASSRQLVVATVASLEGHSIEDYGYRLGRHWQIGQSQANNGVILLVAPNDRKVRIEVGYGLEPIITDALSSQIVNRTILPRFRTSPPDYAGGIIAGADALIAQLGAPPEAAERAAIEAQQAENRRGERRGGERGGDGSIWPLVFWGAVLLFIVLPAFGAGLSGRRYGRRRGRRGVSVWGPGHGRRGDGSGAGWFIAGMALDAFLSSRGGSGGWGGGGGGSSWGGGGGGGFSGGGGSFGGGGASGGW